MPYAKKQKQKQKKFQYNLELALLIHVFFIFTDNVGPQYTYSEKKKIHYKWTCTVQPKLFKGQL